MRVYPLLLVGLLTSLQLSSQTVMNRDSLLAILPSVKEDSAGVEFYINLGQQFETNEPERAKYYYRKAGSISEQIRFPSGQIRSIFNYTYVLNVQGRYDSGLAMNKQAVELARKLDDQVLLGKALFNTGTSGIILCATRLIS